MCTIATEHAEAITAARDARGGRYFAVDEVFIDVHLPTDAQESVPERAFV